MAEKIGTELERFPISDMSGTEQNLQLVPAVERLLYVFVGILPRIVVNNAFRTWRSSPVVSLSRATESFAPKFPNTVIGWFLKGVSGGGTA